MRKVHEAAASKAGPQGLGLGPATNIQACDLTNLGLSLIGKTGPTGSIHIVGLWRGKFPEQRLSGFW